MELLTSGDSRRGFVAAAAVLALGIIIAAFIGSYAFYQARALDNTLSVTGSTKQEVKADVAKWRISVERTTLESGIPAANARIAEDAKAIVAFLTAGGVPSEKVTVDSVSVNQEYSSDQNAPRRYTLRQQITVESEDPEKIASLSKDIGSLVGKGILVNAFQPEYYVTTLPDIRVALIGKAVEDARARADGIVSSTGQKVGKLKSASSGVVQVLAPNSIEVSDYGSYDTSTIEKEVMVTARAVFLIR